MNAIRRYGSRYGMQGRAIGVGVFVRIRGWLECDEQQLTQVREIAEADDADRTHSGGWAFPPRQYNFTNWVFFGAEMRAQSVDWFLDRLRSVARIPASDDDDDLITGLFFVSHEVDGMSEWQVRDGTVTIQAASQEYRDFELDGGAAVPGGLGCRAV